MKFNVFYEYENGMKYYFVAKILFNAVEDSWNTVDFLIQTQKWGLVLLKIKTKSNPDFELELRDKQKNSQASKQKKVFERKDV